MIPRYDSCRAGSAKGWQTEDINYAISYYIQL